MRKPFLIAVIAAGVALPLVAGTAIATAGQRSGFEIEIDPELDREFGPRPVNAVAAKGIVEAAFPGARVTEAELDEENGGPIWEMEFILRGDEREVDVDAVTGDLLTDDDD